MPNAAGIFPTRTPLVYTIRIECSVYTKGCWCQGAFTLYRFIQSANSKYKHVNMTVI